MKLPKNLKVGDRIFIDKTGEIWSPTLKYLHQPCTVIEVGSVREDRNIQYIGVLDEAKQYGYVDIRRCHRVPSYHKG